MQIVDTRASEVDTSGNPQKILTFISKYIDNISPDLRCISLRIHDNPELGFREFIAHKTLVEFLETREGWVVEREAGGMEIAFVASYDSGKKGAVVSYNSEYDALPGIGHACGHNLIAIASVAAALASAAAMVYFHLPGKVVLFGTPAEEGGGGKIRLLDAGVYSMHRVDINLITHPGNSADSVLVRTNAYQGFKVSYEGKAAHAAQAPWEGVNALDALVVAYNAISVLRQQTRPGDTIQACITDGGVRPNIIHAYAAGRFAVRSTTKKGLETLKEKVMKCFEAGALATGAKLTVEEGVAYEDHVPNWALGKVCREAMNSLGSWVPEPEIDFIRGQAAASTDQGNVSHAYPSLSLGFEIESLEGPHSPGFAEAARTMEAHEKALRAGKAIAATGVAVLKDERLLEKAKKEFKGVERRDSSEEKYRCQVEAA